MNRYIVPKILCALGSLIIFAGIFFSELNITLGNYQISSVIAVGITVALLSLVILACNIKKTDNMRKLRLYKKVEFLSVFLFVVGGLASLLIFNHCITVWQRTGEIKEKLNIRQLEKMLPEYEKYAKNRIDNYQVQLEDAILYKDMRSTEFSNLGFDVNEALESQKIRKINKLKQVVYPHIYDTLKISINDSIKSFVKIVENFSPITMPKNITRIEEWAKSWERQLNSFSHEKMKGENRYTEEFRFESTFGNVEYILTYYKDYFSSKRFMGYGIGLIALICMLFPYFKVRRSNKLNY